MIKVAVTGAEGRMGRMIIEAVLENKDMQLVAALDRHGAPKIGQDAGAFLGRNTGVIITDDMGVIKSSGAQVLVDFTRPEATVEYLKVCAEDGCAMVIGTTGFSPEGKLAIEATAKKIPIVFAPNMSAGVNVTFKLVEEAAKLLPSYDCEIVEMHHNKKVDAPSGTAIEMGRIAAQARGEKLEDVAVWERHGKTGERKPGTIGFAALRGGDVVGWHQVIFAGQGETLEIIHRSTSRKGYATGAVQAAEFICGKAPGLYSMQDVLGLKG
ncbi:MAG: 4-hydroxy-tetrahydrodipicolinate reductase [Burkholderiales bacterium]|nr:4-hydroxy-tetrahydrodipicolinate reductase [Burkholderiales bacterium]